MKQRIFKCVLFVGIVLMFCLGLVFTHKKDSLEYDSNTTSGKGSVKWNRTTAELIEIYYEKKEELSKLEVYHTEVKSVWKITQNILPIELTEKYQKIRFHADVIYSIDLSGLNKDSIELDKDNKQVIFKIDKPEKNISLNPDKYEISKKESGFLGFGDIKLTLKEFVDLEQEAKKATNNQIIEDNIQKEANEAAKKEIDRIYRDVIDKEYPGYKIKVLFK